MNTTYPQVDGVMPSADELAEWLFDSYGWNIDEAREFAGRAVNLAITDEEN